ncbi:unnamed protein product [Acanthoscelides obtectus]|uniref:Uncharacterized protein n=1 Tax=Acanthoscelides obtectus TaxID=200917 RepID=A0A9P0Q8Z0_ACAOB|nr:unnamed protein product [Acanthoscelides obtectus]CAK1634482.1 hypothetical protein AOBTE_LOCUS8768 [Acanthoscelides obtectus]
MKCENTCTIIHLQLEATAQLQQLMPVTSAAPTLLLRLLSQSMMRFRSEMAPVMSTVQTQRPICVYMSILLVGRNFNI